MSAAGERMDLDCVLNDIRFVFAVPTAQKLALVGLSLQQLLKQADDKKVQARKEQIGTYSDVLSQKKFDDDPEKIVLDKVLTNLAILFTFNKGQSYDILKQSLRRIDKQKKKESETRDTKMDEIA